jgi:hypothetical protein
MTGQVIARCARYATQHYPRYNRPRIPRDSGAFQCLGIGLGRPGVTLIID